MFKKEEDGFNPNNPFADYEDDFDELSAGFGTEEPKSERVSADEQAYLDQLAGGESRRAARTTARSRAPKAEDEFDDLDSRAVAKHNTRMAYDDEADYPSTGIPETVLDNDYEQNGEVSELLSLIKWSEMDTASKTAKYQETIDALDHRIQTIQDELVFDTEGLGREAIAQFETNTKKNVILIQEQIEREKKKQALLNGKRELFEKRLREIYKDYEADPKYQTTRVTVR